MENQKLKSIEQFAKDIIKDSNGVLSRVPAPTVGFVGRKEEVADVIQSMYKKRMRNCVIVGPSGVGKTEIARKAIRRMSKDFLFLSMNVAALQSGCTLVGQFEQKLLAIVNSIASYNQLSQQKKICLFVDEAHSLWIVGKNDISGSVSAADILKPYLADGTIIILGATTKEEYEQYLKKDNAMLRRISPVFVKDMNREDTFEIVKKFCGGEMSDALVEKCVSVSYSLASVNYTRVHNPDFAIEIADRTMARALYYERMATIDDVEYVTMCMNRKL